MSPQVGINNFEALSEYIARDFNPERRLGYRPYFDPRVGIVYRSDVDPDFNPDFDPDADPDDGYSIIVALVFALVFVLGVVLVDVVSSVCLRWPTVALFVYGVVGLCLLAGVVWFVGVRSYTVGVDRLFTLVYELTDQLLIIECNPVTYGTIPPSVVIAGYSLLYTCRLVCHPFMQAGNMYLLACRRLFDLIDHLFKPVYGEWFDCH